MTSGPTPSWSPPGRRTDRCSTDTCWSTPTCTSPCSGRSSPPGCSGRGTSARTASSTASGTPTAGSTRRALDELFAEQGVDAALLFCEYSPKVTGIQRFEDLLPIVAHNPARFRPVANVNPHLHFPIADELGRQLDQGAAALKLHPVHGGFRCDDAALWPAYAVLAERGVPLDRALRDVVLPRLDERARPPRAPAARRPRLPRPSTWCSPTPAAAGGTTRPRSWRSSTRPCGSSCRDCRPSGCRSTSRSTTSTGWHGSGSSPPTGRARRRPPTRGPWPGSASTTTSWPACSAATRCGVYAGLDHLA